MSDVIAEIATPTRRSDGKGGYIEFVPDELKKINLDVEYNGAEITAITGATNDVQIGDHIRLM